MRTETEPMEKDDRSDREKADEVIVVGFIAASMSRRLC